MEGLLFQNEAQRVLYKLNADVGHISSRPFSEDLQPFKLQVYSKKKKKMCPYI